MTSLAMGRKTQPTNQSNNYYGARAARPLSVCMGLIKAFVCGFGLVRFVGVGYDLSISTCGHIAKVPSCSDHP